MVSGWWCVRARAPALLPALPASQWPVVRNRRAVARARADLDFTLEWICLSECRATTLHLVVAGGGEHQRSVHGVLGQRWPLAQPGEHLAGPRVRRRRKHAEQRAGRGVVGGRARRPCERGRMQQWRMQCSSGGCSVAVAAVAAVAAARSSGESGGRAHLCREQGELARTVRSACGECAPCPGSALRARSCPSRCWRTCGGRRCASPAPSGPSWSPAEGEGKK